MRVGRKPWRYAVWIGALDYAFKGFDEFHGYTASRREEELRRRVLMEKAWIEKRLEVLKDKAENDPDYLKDWEKMDLRPQLKI
jgi:hypothetical protein